MGDHPADSTILRYSRQIVLKAMNHVRTSMRGSERIGLGTAVDNPFTVKSGQNRTKAIDLEAENIMISAIVKKFSRIEGLGPFLIFAEEHGVLRVPTDCSESDARWVIFLDPVDGTEFVETLQGGCTLLAVYDRLADEVAVVVAGDIFLDRLYWASRATDAEALDFITHSWFRLDGGPTPKKEIAGARINVLTTKVSRFLEVAKQRRLLDELQKNDGRINLASGSNLIIQVAAGYADVALEFAKGFATHDLLPGLFIAERAGLAVLDLQGYRLSSRVNIDEILAAYRRNPSEPPRRSFVVAKEEQLARQVLALLDIARTSFLQLHAHS